MSRAEFDERRARLERAPYRLLDLDEETALAVHVKGAMVATARWAARFGVVGGWFYTDYARLAAPGAPPPPEDEIAATLEACRAKGERSRYGARYMDLLLRWAWASPDQLDAVGLPPPYDPLLAIFDAGAGITGEHAFFGTGLQLIRMGHPQDHLGDDPSSFRPAVANVPKRLP